MTILNYLSKLQAAGLPVVDADDSGAASFSRDLTDAERLLLTDIIDPAGIPARARLAQSRITAKAIPNWATWTQAEANTWGQTNIGTPLATARTSLPVTLTLATARAAFVVILNILDQMWILQQANAQMTLALRDAQWPDLPTVALK
jgi:hypothetical protein